MSEKTEAYALVTCTFGGVRYVLLIERGDGGGWAMPGGAVEPGEWPAAAAARELEEGAGLRAPQWHPDYCSLDEPRWVPERNAVTIVARCDLGEVGALPEVRGGDDARSAEWMAVVTLADGISKGVIFPAHREILALL